LAKVWWLPFLGHGVDLRQDSANPCGSGL